MKGVLIMSLDPIETTEVIKKGYLDYLATTFRFKDDDLQGQFMDCLWEPDMFVKGPILEATPPFVTGGSIEELINAGCLSSEFMNLKTNRIPTGPLYLHQEMAIRKSIQYDRNLVIATGTGSGKTEAFLVPILDHLFRQKENSNLTPGVRALLLYPMNALANDQEKRLYEILENYPFITFGRYTGETEKEQKSAEDRYRKMYDRYPLKNELISREFMRKTPPHILLTNYAMLEYLLLRPDDNVFFDGEFAQDWRFIVIDEAHTYSGAKGIEMAMLLRRLKDRIVGSQLGRLRCFATSATLGGGRGDFPSIANFAAQLFGEKFEWRDEDKERQDVIEAKRIHNSKQPAWGKPDRSLYREWKNALSDPSIDLLVEKAKNKGVPESVLINAKANAQNNKGFIYEVIKGDQRVIDLQNLLENEPQYMQNAARNIFGDIPDADESLACLVDLAVYAKHGENERPLIPARYHLFVRATEGAYLSLYPQKTLYLKRHENITFSDVNSVVFEAAVCRQCGSIYLVGETKNINGMDYFSQPGKKNYEYTNGLEFFLLRPEYTEIPIDEDETIGYERDIEEPSDYRLCAICGAITRNDLVGSLCQHDASNYCSLQKVSSRDGNVHHCPACGKRSPVSLVWRILTGNDATASVLAKYLYQQIPPERRNTDEGISIEISEEDEWNLVGAKKAFDEDKVDTPEQGRKLLIFSDNRQDAAFFATYLERMNERINQRIMIMKAIKSHHRDVIENQWCIQDLIDPLLILVNEYDILPNRSRQEKINEIWKWVLYELLSIEKRIGLEGLGCLGFSLAKPNTPFVPKPLTQEPWNLSEDEVWTLFQILLDSFRTKGALLFPDNVSADDEFFLPRTGNFHFRENQASRSKRIFSWSSSVSHAMNSRLDFLIRLAKSSVDGNISDEQCRELLKNIWEKVLFPANRQSVWGRYFSSFQIKDEGVVYSIRHQFWQLRPGTGDSDTKWYYCDRCNNITLHNIRNICPTYRCDGQLRECNPNEILKDNHYRNLYLETSPIPMRTEEHTAQLTSEAASELQTKFINGEVNVLSCSTTFELGVDVGALESVFMRNVPPSSANYIQRAGRAGRRTDSTAFALTYAQRRPHDLSHYNDPKQMVCGSIGVPHFRIENEKIILRHIYATALSSFWKQHNEMFGKVESFFFAEGKSGPTLLKEYLSSKPEKLHQALKRIIPGNLHAGLGIDDWSWLYHLFDENEGVLSRCDYEIKRDIQELEFARNRLIEQNKHSDYILRSINTIKSRYLINLLSSRNVIPKYGFPVDVVELQIIHHSEDANRLELDRDLKIALSEYAPGSQVVAGGKLWTSRYLKKIAGKEWPKYRYAICERCQCYQRVLFESEDQLNFCKACKYPLDGKNGGDRGDFVIPIFGFIVSSDIPQKPGDERPQRTYATRIHYSGKSEDEISNVVLQLKNIGLSAITSHDGELAVINNAGYLRFKVCQNCGYTIFGIDKEPKEHETHWQSKCRGKFARLSLGHEFKTDVLQLRFVGHSDHRTGFWYSLLYSLLEGTTQALDIDRQDLDGCLYPYDGNLDSPALILFDDVPGGAGHVRHIGQNEQTLMKVLKTSLQRLNNCSCGGYEGDASCYGCLRDYRNQFCHDELNRGMIIDFLSKSI